MSDMSNPYLIDALAVISFSGGRTSGFMLWHILDAYGGTLPSDIKVIFNNTGKERPETLDFVERCSQRWGVPVTWLEYRHDGKPTFAVVDYATASRDGTPLATAITARRGDSGYLPNPMVRYCTIETKIKTTIRYLRSLGWDHWTNAVGFRADEPRRVAKLNGSGREKREEGVAPLADAGVTRQDVMAWWRKQPFDLGLEQDDGNCDLCFLKSRKAILNAIQREPWRADWWIEQEARGGRFRNDRPPYRKMLEMATAPTLFDEVDDSDLLSISCHCTD